MESSTRSTSHYWIYGLLLLVILFFALIRWHLRNIPLERDEGEYAYAGQLMLQGVPPYKLVYSMKLPGTFAGYALILAILGQSIAGIHLGLLVVNAATTFLVFLLGKRLFGPLAGLVAGASYGLLSTSASVVGLAGHATHFVVLSALGGLLLLLRAMERKGLLQFFWSGLLLGLAILMKQPGILFAVFGGAYLLYRERQIAPPKWRAVAGKFGAYAAGVALPFALTCLLVLMAGAFRQFWFWTMQYASEYATTIGIGEGFDLLRMVLPRVILPAFWIWVIAGLGLTAIFWNRSAHAHRFFLLGLLLFSAVAVCPGLYFRQHYFILLLSAIALLSGVAVSSASDFVRDRRSSRLAVLLPVVLFLVAFADAIYAQRQYLFEMDPMTASRAVYRTNPFPEAVQVAEYIRNHSDSSTRIAVLGSEPEIYFYAHRHSATGYIYTYGLMEEHQYALEMQKQMIDEIEAARPQYVVYVNVPGSFGRLPDSNPHIFYWMDGYLDTQYELAGVVDLLQQSNYVWGEAAKTYRPRSPLFLRVYKRKTP